MPANWPQGCAGAPVQLMGLAVHAVGVQHCYSRCAPRPLCLRVYALPPLPSSCCCMSHSVSVESVLHCRLPFRIAILSDPTLMIDDCPVRFFPWTKEVLPRSWAALWLYPGTSASIVSLRDVCEGFDPRFRRRRLEPSAARLSLQLRVVALDATPLRTSPDPKKGIRDAHCRLLPNNKHHLTTNRRHGRQLPSTVALPPPKPGPQAFLVGGWIGKPGTSNVHPRTFTNLLR